VLLGGCGVFGGVNELPDFRPLSIEVGEVLRAKLLIHLQLVLGLILFAGADVGLAESIMSVGEIGVELEGALVVRDGLGVFGLIGIEIAQLQLGIGERGVEFD